RDSIAASTSGLDSRAALAGMLRIGRKDDVPFTRLWCQALADSRPRKQQDLLQPGHTLQTDRFEIISLIGGGGQGTVYAATMKDLGQTEMIVLKEYVLPDVVHHEEHKNACEQFEKEIRLLSKVEHENVIKLLDAFVEDHRAYLVLEHFPGVSLRQHVDEKGPFSETQVRELAVKMCDILDHLHNLEPLIMHLDFSPENILYGEDGSIKLIDFNISVEEHSLRTRTVMGKQRYMAPEQYRGKPSPASDIYSLGATLYFLLTAREPEPISVARPAKVRDIDADLDDIVAGATALEENERFASARQMKERLLKS
ncbi:MAG: serine/threonine protein kinase, partial [Cyanobacteria bacterium HKST-UBA02]|nr:serine/threonine protein kinase [Cyanobacteria bacterium HKST-UBA02]